MRPITRRVIIPFATDIHVTPSQGTWSAAVSLATIRAASSPSISSRSASSLGPPPVITTKHHPIHHGNHSTIITRLFPFCLPVIIHFHTPPTSTTYDMDPSSNPFTSILPHPRSPSTPRQDHRQRLTGVHHPRIHPWQRASSAWTSNTRRIHSRQPTQLSTEQHRPGVVVSVDAFFFQNLWNSVPPGFAGVLTVSLIDVEQMPNRVLHVRNQVFKMKLCKPNTAKPRTCTASALIKCFVFLDGFCSASKAGDVTAEKSFGRRSSVLDVKLCPAQLDNPDHLHWVHLHVRSMFHVAAVQGPPQTE
ncbi:hypothetical protein G7046_g6400 [Stylonectria norvegica]|nr:hypothetical protein G7046_g6400 [Stylonectria norvegica]